MNCRSSRFSSLINHLQLVFVIIYVKAFSHTATDHAYTRANEYTCLSLKSRCFGISSLILCSEFVLWAIASAQTTSARAHTHTHTEREREIQTQTDTRAHTH